eukprot:CAMPEP_0206202150 /NCGR_PEP_ID=MMETSP0166-20121206/11991_1 /ASSEMBLY_ACC=CAM_ASM_000260 /TAXON_ID=95228 /ORGANISM="Vannella robusta, Strain DIVA3 518/3/11/1/6" /LENGTH=118 /DNA_ID=CAMNT_0053620999 /DNA_START=24 /DNA_END=380 /DNA_ORIENTATION=-
MGKQNEQELTKAQKRNKKRNEAKKKAKRVGKANQTGDDGMVVNILESMVTPGVDRSVIKMLNIVFVFLFLILLIMLLFVGSVHYAVMLFFAGGLFFSIQFFLFEASKNPHILNPPKQK